MPFEAARFRAIQSELLANLPGDWSLAGGDRLKNLTVNQLKLVGFTSDLLDNGAAILKKHDYARIKSKWHVTLGKIEELDSETVYRMTELLSETKWEWAVAFREQSGRVFQRPVWSQTGSF